MPPCRRVTSTPEAHSGTMAHTRRMSLGGRGDVRRVRAENSSSARAPDGDGGAALTRRGGHRGSTVTEAVRDVLAAEGPTYTVLWPVPSRHVPAEVSQ